MFFRFLKYTKHLIFIIPIFYLFSCSKKTAIKKPVQELEAKMSDVPAPLNLYSISSSNNSLNYSINCEKAELIKFYQENLEIYGWKEIVIFDEQNTILIYEKPHKFLSILIMASKDVLKVSVYTKEKFTVSD